MPASRASFDHRIARDAFQNAGLERRRPQHAVADEEDVVARAFGDFALVVEHQGFDAAGLQAFDLGQNVVEVVERLDPRVERRRMHPLHADREISRPFSYSSCGIERDRVGDDDHLRIAATIGVEAERAGAAGDDEANVAVVDFVDPDGLVRRRRTSRRAPSGCRARSPWPIRRAA